MAVTTTFTPVKLASRKKFLCRVCGRPGFRSRTFWQTINPLNKNAAGQPKTYDEIWQELQCAAIAWRPDVHVRCES